MVEMSFMVAETVYIPYVGGQIMMLSLEGRQKMRRMMSIASSEPLPM